MPSTYYLGQSPDEALGDSPRYWYALRRNEDGELFLLRSDQLKDKDSIELNLPGAPSENFEDFEPDSRWKACWVEGCRVYRHRVFCDFGNIALEVVLWETILWCGWKSSGGILGRD